MKQGQDPQAEMPGVPWTGATGPLRVGTAEREQTVDALTAHATAGRLEPEEFDARITAALTARTVDDLQPLLADLPCLTLGAPTPPVRPRARQRRLPLIPRALQPWLTSSLITVVIWAASGGGYFWPIWVIGPWGVITLMSLAALRHTGGEAGGCHDHGAQRSRRHDRDQAASSTGRPSGPFG
jgi:hypothetical protein